MTIQELFTYCCVRSGQFIVGMTPEDFNLDVEKWWLVVQPLLSYYESHRPNMLITSVTLTGGSFTWPSDTAPDWISKVDPVGTGGILPSLLVQGVVGSSLNPFRDQMDWAKPWGLQTRARPTFIYRYNKPTLYASHDGSMTVKYARPYTRTERRSDDTSVLLDVNLPDIRNDGREFPTLVYACFLQAIGRSRRAFTYRDLPVETDAVALVQEGLDLFTATQQKLELENDWYLGTN